MSSVRVPLSPDFAHWQALDAVAAGLVAACLAVFVGLLLFFRRRARERPKRSAAPAEGIRDWRKTPHWVRPPDPDSVVIEVEDSMK